jgi:DNA-binding response OmpR family regulator
MKEDKTSGALQAAGAQTAWESSTSYRILVADDDDAVRLMMTEMLSRSGFQVDSASDGEAAWEALNTELYDLLITDNSMPRLAGIDLLKKIRAARMDVPAIMVSGEPPKEQFTLYPWLRPAAVLVKPCTVTGLLSAVAEVMRAHRAVPVATAPTIPDRQASFLPGSATSSPPVS